MMEIKVAMLDEDLESRWRIREKQWRRKLGRLRLGVEPIDDQLARYKRVTWALTAVPVVIGSFFLTLFTVFRRPGIGLVVDAIIFLPIIGGAWLDYALLAMRARRFLVERGQYLRDKEQVQPANGQMETTSEQA